LRAGQRDGQLSRFSSRVVLQAGRRLNLGPHGIVLLLVASILLPSGFGAGTYLPDEETHAATAECVLLEGFLGSPELLANFKGTPEELQRWVDAYRQHCS